MSGLSKTKLICGGLAALAAVTAVPRQAAALPAATSSAICSTSNGNINSTTSCSTGTDLAEVTQTPAASTHAEATYPGNLASVTAGATAQLNYSWSVVGPTAGELVPVDIAVHVIAATFGSVNATAFAAVTSLTGPSGTVQICVDPSGRCAGGTNEFDGFLLVKARVGEVNTLAIEATAGGAFSVAENGGTAFANAFLFLEPDFPNPGNYSFEFSPNVGNAAAPVPIPAGAGMLVTAIAMLGGRRRNCAKLRR